MTRVWAFLRSRRLRWPRRVLGALVAAWLVLAIAWHVAIRIVGFPDDLLAKAPASSLTLSDANGVLLRQEATSAGTKERWVALDQISPYLVAATLASEDNDFYDHGGVDWSAIARASWLDLRGRSPEFGGSTITGLRPRRSSQLARAIADQSTPP